MTVPEFLEALKKTKDKLVWKVTESGLLRAQRFREKKLGPNKIVKEEFGMEFCPLTALEFLESDTKHETGDYDECLVGKTTHTFRGDVVSAADDPCFTTRLRPEMIEALGLGEPASEVK